MITASMCCVAEIFCTSIADYMFREVCH
uniref:Uncharacterized protein n=1 Tax=Arundo donax TaxID=35708 RepID=A0A0A9HWA4_ARUDO